MSDVKQTIWRRIEDYLLSSGSTGSTLEKYNDIFNEYYVDAEDLWSRDFLTRHLADKARMGNNGNSLRSQFYTIKTFFVANEKPFPLDKRQVPKKVPKQKPKFTEDQMALLEKVAEASNIRDLAIIRVCEELGNRRTEMVNINVDDYHRPFLILRTLKHGRIVKRELSPSTCDIIERWLRVRSSDYTPMDQAMFTHLRGKEVSRISARGLSEILQRIRGEAGVNLRYAGFHAIRRARVSAYRDSGLSGEEVTQIMGWEDPSTYLEYSMPDEELTAEKAKLLNPFMSKHSAPVEEASKPSEDEVPLLERLKRMTPVERSRYLQVEALKRVRGKR